MSAQKNKSISTEDQYTVTGGKTVHDAEQGGDRRQSETENEEQAPVYTTTSENTLKEMKITVSDRFQRQD